MAGVSKHFRAVIPVLGGAATGLALGVAASYDLSGPIAGAISGAAVGIIYFLLMERIQKGSVIKVLSGAGLGSTAGFISGLITFVSLCHPSSHTHILTASLLGAFFGIHPGFIYSFLFIWKSKNA